MSGNKGFIGFILALAAVLCLILLLLHYLIVKDNPADTTETNGTATETTAVSGNEIPQVSGNEGQTETSLESIQTESSLSVESSTQDSTASRIKLPLYGDQTFRTSMVDALSKPQERVLSKGSIYYVSPQGDDANSGTQDKPFGSFEYAIGKLKAGDTLYLLDGTYSEKMILPAQLQGNADQYITIAGAPGATATLDGTDLTSPELVEMEGCGYVQLSNLTFTGASALDACGILVDAGSNHLLISGNTMTGISVPDPTTQDHCANCILLLGDDPDQSISNVLIYGNTFSDCQTGWAECIAVSAYTENVNVVSNTITNTGNIGIDFSGNYGYCSDASKDFPMYGMIYQNTVSNCVSPNATSYGIYVDGAQEITVQDNTVSQCSGGIEVGAEKLPSDESYSTAAVTLDGNTVDKNTEAGIAIGGYDKGLGWVKNVMVKNNICTDNGTAATDGAILILSKCDGISFLSNKFQNQTGSAAVVDSEMDATLTTNITFQKNTYSNSKNAGSTNFIYLGKSYTSYKDWAAAAGDTTGVYSAQ